MGVHGRNHFQMAAMALMDPHPQEHRLAGPQALVTAFSANLDAPGSLANGSGVFLPIFIYKSFNTVARGSLIWHIGRQYRALIGFNLFKTA